MDINDFSNAQGYGFWCNDKCAEKKIASGIPPLGSGRATKDTEAQAELLMAQAATNLAAKKDKSWSAAATAGVVIASLLGIALTVILIKRAKRK
tara:strand:- start:1573 stop:1854 length:282 start_codon:yes stop_codon:yes gene_type:complete